MCCKQQYCFSNIDNVNLSSVNMLKLAYFTRKNDKICKSTV